MALFMNIKSNNNLSKYNRFDRFDNNNNNINNNNINNNNINQKKISTTDLLEFIKENFLELNNENNNIKEISLQEEKNESNNDSFNDTIVEKIISLQQNATKELGNCPDFITGIIKNFKNNLTRTGIQKYNDEQKHISLYTSILTCIKPDFKFQSASYQQNYVKQLNQNLVSFVNSKFLDFKYKELKWNKNDTILQIKTMNTTKTVLKLLSDHLHLNIFVIDIESDTFNIVDNISPFKKNILLLLINKTNFEPLCFDYNYCLLPDSPLIQHLIGCTTDITKYIDTTQLSLETELDKYLSSQKDVKLSLHDKKILYLIKQQNQIEQKNKLNDDTEQTLPIIDTVKDLTIHDVEKKETSDIQITHANNIDDENTEDDNKDDNEDDNFKDNKSYVDDISQDNNSKLIITQIKLPDSHDQVNNNDVKKNLQNKKYNEKTMKLDELQEDAKKLNIPINIGNKKKTKAQLIIEIVAGLK